MTDLSKYANKVYKIIGAAMTVHYLRLTRKPIGLLINFGEESLVGERWAYDQSTNECFLVDKNMEPVEDADYSYLLDDDEEQDN